MLRLWSWILENNLETRKAVRTEFEKTLLLQKRIYDQYFAKLLPIAKKEDGLFAENVGPFEEIGYPIRCFDFLNSIIYYYELCLYYNDDDDIGLLNEQKE